MSSRSPIRRFSAGDEASQSKDERGRSVTPPNRTRSRSRSPASRDHYRRYGRSRSPQREDSREREGNRSHKQKGGFRWKEKRTYDGGPDSSNSKLERGYRAQEQRERTRYRERSRDRNYHNSRDHRHERDDRRHRDHQRNYGERRSFKREQDRSHESQDAEKKTEPREKKEKRITAQPTEAMIVVYVNDRLGTKAGIPCLPSDPIKLFKAQVAARVGREPHEIMLKRQGERPFKDQLTLEDYGVSNGVQLDLEVDTGD